MSSTDEPAEAALADVSRLDEFLLSEASLDELLQHVVTLARRSVPAADSVTVSLNKEHGYETPTATDNLGLELDDAQYSWTRVPASMP